MDIENEITTLKQQVEQLTQLFSSHAHEGALTTQIVQGNVVPSIRAMGSIEMATNGRTYSIGVIDNPTSIWFYGFAVHSSVAGVAPFNIRSHVVGNGQLGKSFYFQPQSSSSVIEGGIPQNIIQSCSSMTIADGNPPVIRTTVGQFDLVSVGYPDNSIENIVARAEITLFAVDHIEIFVTLQAGWAIEGNFLVT